MNLINNALSGALAAQAALNATSQNIANVATVGYTRQGALLVTANATQSGTVSAGNGVTVSQLLRFSDSYTSQQMWSSNSTLGQYTVSQPYLTQMEQVMGDDTSNIGSGLDDFFSALNAVSVDPTSSPLRQQVLTSAQSLAQRFDNLNGVLSTQVTSIHQQRSDTVDQINETANDIATLNQQITQAQATNVNASGLMDARDQKIDALAGLVGIQVVNQPNGSRDVSLAGGQPLVVGSVASKMSAQGNADGSQTLKVAFVNQTFTLSDGSLGGQLGGLGDYEQNVLQPLQQSISDMASQIASKVNTQLAAGYGVNGTAGGPLFDFDPTGSTGMLKLDTSATAANLGFSGDPSLPGNSDNLLTLIGLKNQQIPVGSLGLVLMGDANSQLVGQLGTNSQQNQASMATAQTVRDQSTENWKSVSGVNSDEEAVNLVQYQQMYQANMKVMTVADTLFDATLAMMGP
jgi:flagellar hook-associated protein 1 FlgK